MEKLYAVLKVSGLSLAMTATAALGVLFLMFVYVPLVIFLWVCSNSIGTFIGGMIK